MTKEEILDKVVSDNLTENQHRLYRAMYKMVVKQEQLERCEDKVQRNKLRESIYRYKRVIEACQAIEDAEMKELKSEEDERQRYLDWFNSLPLMTQAALFVQDVKFRMPKKVTKMIQIGHEHTAKVWRSYKIQYAEVI